MKFNRSILSGVLGAAAGLVGVVLIYILFFRPAAPTPSPSPAAQPTEQPSSAPAQKEPLDISEIPSTPISVSPESPPTSMPASRPALLHQADLALAAGNIDDAVSLYRKAAEANPSLDALRGLAMALDAGQQYKQVIPVYHRILEDSAADKTAQFNLAMAYLRTGNMGQAEAYLKQLVKNYPDFTEARSNLAAYYQHRARLTEAREQWEELLRRQPDLLAAQIALGEVYTDLRRPKDALHCYEQAAKLAPKDASIQLNLAVAALNAGSAGRAVLALERSLQLAPYDAEAWSMLGDVHLEIYRAAKEPEEKKKHLQQAVQNWERSLKEDPAQPKLKDRLKTYRYLLAEN